MTLPPQTQPVKPSAADPVEEFLKRRKKATINDVAALARVSKKTVSRIINNSPSVREETREAVNAIIARIGFRPDPQARGLAFRRSFLLGLIYDNPNAQYIVNMQMGILDKVRGSGIELVVHPCDKTSDSFLEEIRDFVELQRLSGVILLPPIAENRQLIQVLEELAVPFVRITARHGDDNSPPIKTSQVVSRDRMGCQQAADHLVELGHRRIGFIEGPHTYASAKERRQGFAEGLKAHGLDIDPAITAEGAYSFESGFEAGQKILSQPDRPTAIFASNDEMAIGAYKAALQMGLSVPGDLSIIGFDDSPLASRIYPALTTVRLPIRDMGRTAAETLIDQDNHRKHTMIFDAALVVRDSTAPAPKTFKP
jgi:LacI family transcriptional regulator